MNVNPASIFGGLPMATPSGIPGANVAPAPGVPTMAGCLRMLWGGFIEDANQQQVQADMSVHRLATGESESVHETMLALAKADLSLRMFVEVRNKVIDAYQQVMQTQL